MRRILHIEHDWGGGLSRHVTDLASFLHEEGIQSLRCRPSQTFWLDMEVISGMGPHQPIRMIPSDTDQCVATIREMNIIHAHFHSIVNYSPFTVDRLLHAFQCAELQYDFTIHDYAAICPRIHMMDFGKLYCDVASFAYCDRCVSMAGTPFGEVEPQLWRARYLRLLQGARSIIVPNIDVAERIKSYLGQGVQLKVKPHPEPVSYADSRPARQLPVTAPGRRIAIIGRLTAVKGLHVVRAMVLDALCRDLALQFVIFGEPDSNDLASFPNVEVKGAFEEDKIDAMIRDDPPDVAFFPSVCPETHLYTLSIAFRNLLPPIVFDIGSQAERVRRARFGFVVPYEMALRPHRLNDYLATISISSISAREVHSRRAIAAWDGARSYYGLSGI